MYALPQDNCVVKQPRKRRFRRNSEFKNERSVGVRIEGEAKANDTAQKLKATCIVCATVKRMENTQEVRKAIRELAANYPSGSHEDLVALLRTNEPELIDRWLAEKLAHLVRDELRTVPNGNQLFLPGFKDIYRKLPVGKQLVALGSMNITMLRTTAKQFRMHDQRSYISPKVARINELIKQMQPYAKKVKGLTVETFYKIRANEAQPNVVIQTKNRKERRRKIGRIAGGLVG